MAHQRLHLNQYGLPSIIFRPDLLPQEFDNKILDAETQQPTGVDDKSWDVAQINISYAEGFPTLDGNPIWERLEFESLEAFTAFEMYIGLQDKLEGSRALFLLIKEESCKHSREELNEMFFSFYWPQRALAYDVYNATVAERRRDHRTVKIDDIMFDNAKELGGLALDYIKDDEFVELMTPKIALDMYGMSVKHQRLALGMNPAGPTPAAAKRGDRTLEISASLRQMSSENAALEGGEEVQSHMRDAILQNPELLAKAQDIVIKITEKGQE